MFEEEDMFEDEGCLYGHPADSVAEQIAEAHWAGGMMSEKSSSCWVPGVLVLVACVIPFWAWYIAVEAIF